MLPERNWPQRWVPMARDARKLSLAASLGLRWHNYNEFTAQRLLFAELLLRGQATLQFRNRNRWSERVDADNERRERSLQRCRRR